MKISKKILSLMLCMIMCIMTMATGSVYSFAEDGDYEESEIEHTVEIGDNTLIYTIENGEIAIVGCEGESYGVLEIPEEIDGYPVTTIGNGPVHGDFTMKYKSSNSKVASVDDNGKVTALKKGSATITCAVTDSNGNSVSDTCEVKVVYTWWQWIIKVVLFGWIWYK